MRNILFLLLLLLSVSWVFTENIHPHFNIEDLALESIYKDLSEESVNAIENSKYDFLDTIDKLITNCKADLTLVDKNHRLSSDFIPENMINLSDYNLSTRYKTMMFVSLAIDDFIAMSKAAELEGIELFIASTYRSYAFQDQIFTNMKNYHGEEEAATRVAYPGASQHQLGSAVDFGSITQAYANTEAGKWLFDNSWKYGFTLSYPMGMQDLTSYMWEPWHFRYLGIDAAKLQRNYFEDLQQLFLVFWNKYSGFFIEKHIQ